MSLSDQARKWSAIADLKEPNCEMIVAHTWLKFDVAMSQQTIY